MSGFCRYINLIHSPLEEVQLRLYQHLQLDKPLNQFDILLYGFLDPSSLINSAITKFISIVYTFCIIWWECNLLDWSQSKCYPCCFNAECLSDICILFSTKCLNLFYCLFKHRVHFKDSHPAFPSLVWLSCLSSYDEAFFKRQSYVLLFLRLFYKVIFPCQNGGKIIT